MFQDPKLTCDLKFLHDDKDGSVLNVCNYNWLEITVFILELIYYLGFPFIIFSSWHR